MSLKKFLEEAKKERTLRRVNLMLSEGDIRRLDLLAKFEGVSRSKIVRDLIDFGIVNRLAKVTKKREQFEANIRALNEAEDFLRKRLIKFQEEAGPFQCPFCKAEPFDTKKELEAHIKKTHPRTLE